MRILLSLVLLLNSLSAFAAAVTCETPQQLMALNVSTPQFTKICKEIIKQDPGCKKLKPEKRMSCNSKKENEILSQDNLLAKAGQCAKGFLWDSMVDLAKFVLDIIKLMVKSQVNSVVGMIRFLSDSEYRAETIASSKTALNQGSKLAFAFLNSAGLYFAREFPRNIKKYPFNPLKAIGETLLSPLLKLVTEAVQGIAAHYVPQYQCMNGTAKLYTICRLLGDFVMPPAFMFAFLKNGIVGLKTLSNGADIAKIVNFQKRFAEANEIKVIASLPRKAPKPNHITLDHLPGAPASRRAPSAKPTSLVVTDSPKAHPIKPTKPQPLTKPIEEHSADELVEIARAEKEAVADLNRKELAKLHGDQTPDAKPTITPEELAIQADAEKLIKETADAPALIVKYQSEPEYAELFKLEKQYPEQNRDLAIVISDIEKRNPAMSKAQIKTELQKHLNTCTVK